MKNYTRNPHIESDILPVEIVLHPSWWHKHAGITFDEDFFFHPLKRVESEQKMEKVLYERFGQYGLGKNHDQAKPEIGAVHNAAGFLLSEMLGCHVNYHEDSAPQVHPADAELIISPEKAFTSPAFKRFSDMTDQLKTKFGYLTGDVNWGGLLNLALDHRGSTIFMDMFENPDAVSKYLANISQVIEKFVTGIQKETGSNSISVNRNVINIKKPVFLHSECSHTMISNDQYEDFLMQIDAAWSKKYRPFGIHYCGPDPHRYAESFAKLPYLDFLDLGWGGDVKELRKHLPNTFLNIRLNPVSIVDQTPDKIKETVTRLVKESANPYLTGVCCINMDDKVSDEQVKAIFEAVNQYKKEFNF
jgi:uroporphyrinogen-III decarboxylase